MHKADESTTDAKKISPDVGWLTFWGCQTAIALSAFLSGTLVQGIIVLTTPTYDPKPWQYIFFSGRPYILPYS